MAEEQIDFGEEYGGSQKMPYHGGGAIPALADEELMGEDDEYDDLYNDVNVGAGFQQMNRSEAPSAPSGVVNSQRTDFSNPSMDASQGKIITGPPVEGKYPNTGTSFHDQKVGQQFPSNGASAPQKGIVMELNRDAQVRNMGFQGPTSVPQKSGQDTSDAGQKSANEPAHIQISGTAGPQAVTQIPTSQMAMNANVNRQMVRENQLRPPVENGPTMLFVGELHWWTTDAELENVLSQYGRVKEIKFFDERASGKSKGYCQVEFYDGAAAAACKEGMNGHIFNGRACVVAFASPETLKQMGASYVNKTQGHQNQAQGRRAMNEGAGRGGNMNFEGGDTGRNYGRGSWGRSGQGFANRGPGGGGPVRGRGSMGPKNMAGNSAGVGAAGVGNFGQGMAGPAFGGPPGAMMHPQNMMGAGFDPTYMGRGGGYGGFSGPGFPGMLPSFPAVNAMGLPGVAPHVNPAFFGRGMAPNGMGMMGSSGLEGPQAGMWNDTNMSGWGGEEHDRRTRESSYGADDGGSEYGYGETNHEKGTRSSVASREKERVPERDWSGSTERRHREEREHDRDRSEREHRYRVEKDSYREHRHRERDSGYDDEWGRGQSSSRSRSRSRAMPEEEHRSRSRDVDYGKRKRPPS